VTGDGGGCVTGSSDGEEPLLPVPLPTFRPRGPVPDRDRKAKYERGMREQGFAKVTLWIPERDLEEVRDLVRRRADLLRQ